MEMIKINIKKIFLCILIIIVTFLVIAAVYSNRYKFSGINTIKYRSISVNNETSIGELANRFSDNITKAKFVSETERINNLGSSDYIPINSILIIPIIEYE
ncbi:MAG: hypothetical protein A2Z35_01740 [Actinobacteria bacterium RBG_19FT_COMBO_36_27]|nr:MAG: hypothetical protein A2Z35_01740 [Actinobacteria bacterium RBG_19FT_COMBO_36_27]OGD31224.1 MAG: hypothetical protein A2V94_07730 [Candidatus Atribacteria bacterium RBG_16_35_8]